MASHWGSDVLAPLNHHCCYSTNHFGSGTNWHGTVDWGSIVKLTKMRCFTLCFIAAFL